MPKLATDAPLDPAVLEALKRYDSPTLSNAIETFDVRPRDVGYTSMEIRCIFPDLGPMVGYAATATIRARGRPDHDHCVTDGCVRDLKEARAMGFHFFARGPGVSHAYVRVESAGIPVTVGGMPVSPGDLMHADQHGVLLIPREIAGELPAAAERVIAAEQSLLRWVRSPEFDADELIERRRVKH